MARIFATFSILALCSREVQSFLGVSKPPTAPTTKRTRLEVLADQNGFLNDSRRGSNNRYSNIHRNTVDKYTHNLNEKVPVPLAVPVIDPVEDEIAQSLLESDICILEPLSDVSQCHKKRMILHIDGVLRIVPFLFPVVAFELYSPIARVFAAVLESASNNNWVAVDGGQYQALIIAPAINGIVVPSLSILFASLIGNTINVLRERQLSIRNIINLEAGQLRLLGSMLDAFPPSESRDKLYGYLYQYCSRILSEGTEMIDLEALDLSGMDSELNGIVGELNKVAISDTDKIPDQILAESYGACRRLLEERSRRITYLQSTFPPLHYAIVSTLALSICTCFLIETDQELLVFLNAIQLRLLWTMLVGTFSALAVVCYDLSNPFRGSYQISCCVDQFYTIQMGLKSTIEQEQRRKEKQKK